MRISIVNSQGGRRLLIITLRLLRNVFTGMTQVNFLSIGRRRNAACLITVQRSKRIRRQRKEDLIPPIIKIRQALIVTTQYLMVSMVIFRGLKDVIKGQICRPSYRHVHTLTMIFHALNIRLLTGLVTHVNVRNVRVTINVRPTRIMRHDNSNDLSTHISNHHVRYRTSPSTSTRCTSAINVRLLTNEGRIRHHARILHVSIQEHRVTKFTPALANMQKIRNGNRRSTFNRYRNVRTQQLFLRHSREPTRNCDQGFSFNLLKRMRINHRHGTVTINGDRFPIIRLITRQRRLIPFIYRVRALFRLRLQFWAIHYNGRTTHDRGPNHQYHTRHLPRCVRVIVALLFCRNGGGAGTPRERFHRTRVSFLGDSGTQKDNRYHKQGTMTFLRNHERVQEILRTRLHVSVSRLPPFFLRRIVNRFRTLTGRPFLKYRLTRLLRITLRNNRTAAHMVHRLLRNRLMRMILIRRIGGIRLPQYTRIRRHNRRTLINVGRNRRSFLRLRIRRIILQFRFQVRMEYRQDGRTLGLNQE